MIFAKVRTFPALVAFAAVLMSACGSDSTGPGSVDTNAALQSLALGLQGLGGIGSPTAPEPNPSFGGIAPLLDQVTVTMDGAPQEMFALGLRQTFPPGTCEETLFLDPAFPPEPGVCTHPPLELTVILWASHSASQPPDRMILLAADEGTANFDFASSVELPALALYLEGEDDLWVSLSGTLVSQIARTSQTCDLPLPPYAKSGTCNIATFDEQGSIVFERLAYAGPYPEPLSLVIPRQTLHGLWLAISEVQPITLTANRLTSVRPLTARIIGERLAAGRLVPAR
ncbi:MAG: hypothetical protein M3P26_14920 [Gemmatimonadota bacterium]|nr:hypothetical protein [Gemmatimonadota bacterium]